MKYLLYCLLLVSTVVAAQDKKPTYTYKEKYRPQFHFSPAVNWTNDPNGLVYFNGEYHLFYQYNPFGNVWGHMTWAHSVSKDLLHWRALPIAIKEENNIMIFSGGAVVDYNNTSGFAANKDQTPMVAIYTGHYIANASNPDNYSQAQYIAYSLDKGRTWTKYNNNPVLDLHKKDFRDPNVFWYEPQHKWIMTVVLPHEHIVQFYSSTNLKQWTHEGNFGPAGDVKDIWECPALVQVPVEGVPNKKKWVLFNSQQTTMQYFVGEFDGKKFINENTSSKIYRPDYGPDYYAAVTYNNLPAGESPILLGWANNWTYAKDIPTNPWRSAMSLPRQLSVKKVKNEWILLQQPVNSINALRGNAFAVRNTTVVAKQPVAFKSQQAEIETTLQPSANATGGIRIAVGGDHYFEIGYDAAKQTLYTDRSKTANQSFNKSFENQYRSETRVALQKGQLKLHIFFDHSIVEIFVNDGEAVLTMQLFPEEKDNGVELFSRNGATIFSATICRELRSVW